MEHGGYLGGIIAVISILAIGALLLRTSMDRQRLRGGNDSALLKSSVFEKLGAAA